jgi:hypothetical protein
MTVHGASRPGGEPPGQDRWAASGRGIIVLDGASAFDPCAASADRYVDALLATLVQTLDSAADLTFVLRDAIAHVTYQLQLDPGGGPSSTVLLLRDAGERVEIAVLGDSTALIGFRDGHTERMTDDRMQHVAEETRARYRRRLSEGAGFDAQHRELLREIQRAERAVRNTEDGYWIAEADKMAGHHATVRHYPHNEIAWCVLATDGAQRGFDHLGTDWTVLPKDTDEQLADRLDDLQSWEALHDPGGAQLPRSKRHDDKTLVTWTPDDHSRHRPDDAR